MEINLTWNELTVNRYLTGGFSFAEAPVVLTLPHFLDTSNEYTSLIEGLSPNEDLHTTIVVVEPVRGNVWKLYIILIISLLSPIKNTGSPMVGHKRAQINMFLRPITGVGITDKINTALVPIVWIDEGIQLNEKLVSMIRTTLIDQLQMVDIVHWTLFAGGLAIFLVFITWYVCTRNNGKGSLQ